jgi:hypothetical protein
VQHEYESLHFASFLNAAAGSAPDRRESFATSDAPPINPPSTFGIANNSPAFDGFTLPPYRIGSLSATAVSRSAMRPRMKACASSACCDVAVRPVPMAQTGS